MHAQYHIFCSNQSFREAFLVFLSDPCDPLTNTVVLATCEQTDIFLAQS